MIDEIYRSGVQHTEIPKLENIVQQLDVYEVTKKQDEHETVLQNIDLSDPDALFFQIKKGAAEYGYGEDLIRILQNLMIIPNHQRALRLNRYLCLCPCLCLCLCVLFFFEENL